MENSLNPSFAESQPTGLHENAAFQSTKSNTFQGEARPLGFEGTPCQHTAPPKKSILLNKRVEVSTNKRIVGRETGMFYEKVVARVFDFSQIQSPAILHQKPP